MKQEPARLSASADARLLELIGDTIELLELDEFREALLHALRRAVPADWVGISDIGPDPASIVELVDPPIGQPELGLLFAELAYQNPLIAHYERTHDGRAMRISDLVSEEQFHALEVYQRVYRVIGVRHQMSFSLPHTRQRLLGVHLSRRDRDFTDDEVQLIEAARPFLIQAYRNAIRYSNVLAAGDVAALDGSLPELYLSRLGLTVHQARILRLAASGLSDQDIALHLAISRRTVQKHLERTYRALGVSSRAEAIAKARASIL